MQAWIAAMFVGFLVIGLGRDRPSRRANRLVLLVIIVIVGFEASRLHAI
jgi:hypothetical protein